MISRIAKVFKIKIAMNHFLWEFLAAFHKATPFQGKAQRLARKISKKILGSVEGTIIIFDFFLLLFYPPFQFLQLTPRLNHNF